MSRDTSIPTLTRRGFVTSGGALFVGLAALPDLTLHAQGSAAKPTTLDATAVASWLEIHEDGRVVARTGKTETGTSASAFYAQMIAEELDVDYRNVTMVMGHTDETPDGGLSAGFLGGANNQKKVAAYTRQALLSLASTRLGVPAADLTVTNGIVRGGGKEISYALLVKGQQLDLKIPIGGSLAKIDPKNPVGIGGLLGINVTGTPPVKKIDDYTVVGVSHERPLIRDIVMGKPVFSGDVVLPGMLHARMVRPATVGSTLVAAGALDRRKFPTAEVVVKGNLVAVVSPGEWEAVQGAQAVAAATKWTPWSGLPGSDKVVESLRGVTWELAGKKGDGAKVDAALAGAAKVITATYEQGCVRHAPMGAFVATADARPDGSVTIWAQSSQPQGARANIANTLGIPFEKVTVRWAQGPGQYGRTTYGGDSAMADAAILSTLLGKPVRVQWTLAEDLAWSSLSPAWYDHVKAGLDAEGNLVALQNDWYSPHENDARMLGAILAGMPTLSPGIMHPFQAVATVWPYDKAVALEQVFTAENIANGAAAGGLRGNIMRTPQHRQPNVAVEGLITEAAAVAKADPVEYRIRHTSNAAYARILREVSDAHGWTPRPSPNPAARRTGSVPVTGRGVGVIFRGGIYVAMADVEVVPATGAVRLTALTLGVDVGKVMNPRHLTSMLQGGAVMGVGEALFEEVTFDASRVTSTDWTKYRIPRMADLPDMKVVFTSRNDRGISGGGEGANGAAPVAIMAAFFDATGVMPRRIPLTPGYVTSILRA
ncbi:MAG: molybdopterin cofactor-binding domain-containing protein [Alphaproteobacteria bacterium]